MTAAPALTTRPRSTVREAGPEDDAAIRALLRDRPMEGAIRLALTREPDASIAARVEGERHATFVVRDADDRLVGMGTRSVQRAFVGGRPALLGYLGQLRVVEGACGIKRLREGYARLRAARRSDELPFDLTAIVNDNAPARRLLERGLPGLPRYRPLGEIETLIVPTARRRRDPRVGRLSTARDLDRVAAFLREALRDRPFAPVWTRDALRTLPGLDAPLVLEEGGAIVAAGAVWDQRAFKQAVVTGYAPWLARARPLVNVGLRAIGQPTLPPAGSTLPLAYASAFAVVGDRRARVDRATLLLEALRRRARAAGLGQLVLSLAVADPLRAPLRRRFAARPYRSTLYAVSWPDVALPDDLPGPGVPHIEAGRL